MKNDMITPPLSVQTLAEFLRDLAYSETLFHSTDWNLSVLSPKEGAGHVSYVGSVSTHSRVRPAKKYIYLSFRYTDEAGISNVKATVDGALLKDESAMDFSAFRTFAMSLFEAETLYATKQPHERKKRRAAANVPTLQELIAFMDGLSPAAGGPADWGLHVLHPRDDCDDVSYSGGLWTHHPLGTSLPSPFHSISFSYSKTRGLYHVMAWDNRAKVKDEKRMTFRDFKAIVCRLFPVTTNADAIVQEDT